MEGLRPRSWIEYLGILWQRKLLIFLVTAPMLTATSLIIRRIPNLYESRALIVISNRGNDNRAPAGSTFAALTQQMTSQGNLAAITSRYDLYPQAPRGTPDPNAAVERLRKEVKFDIKMRNYYPEAPESLAISYRYTDPVIAQRVVADLVSLFEQANVTMREQTASELEQFRAQIADAEAQLEALAPQREQALLREATSRRPDNASSEIRAQRLSATNQIDALNDREFMLEKQIEEQKRQISEQEKVVRSTRTASGLASSGAYGVLLARRAEIEAQIKELAGVATEKDHRMIKARAQLSSINREIEQIEAAGGTNLEVAANPASPEFRELRAMQRELQRLQTELEITRRDLDRKKQSLISLPMAPGAEAAETVPDDHLSDTKAEYDRLKGRYNWLMDKQDSLQKQSGGDGANTTMFQVIDAPYAQSAPVGPNRMFLRLLGLGIALALGLLTAAALGAPRLFRINNDLDVQYYLGAPVLALIPEKLTPFERSRRRRLWGLRCLGLGLLAAAMVPALVILLERIQIFQILASR